ncbi:MAG: type 1 glutamine amidotransferase [Afipia felis]|nr:type 1 glutamine amidotransferase [Afipia felis]
MRILVFQHLAIEHPGIFRQFWREDGHHSTTVELDEGEAIPALEDFDLMVVMGGPQNVWHEERCPWLVQEKAAIRHWVQEMQKPYLGICLGHQLLASALGGKVGKMPSPEVGLASVTLTREGLSDPALAGFPQTVEAFHWHGAEVSEPPAGAAVLGSSALCTVQAMRWGRHAYGFQYHCEIEHSTVDDWGQIPAYRTSLIKALGEDGASHLAGDVQPRLPGFHASARQLHRNLMNIVDSGRP